MVYIRLLVCVGMLLSLFSCQRTYSSYPTTMLRAEQLMDLAPDSAKNLLLRLKDSIPQQSEEVQMYYHLLTVKANDKCYVPHTSDSLMKALVYYYEQHGTSAQRMEAYYYLGSVYRDMHDAPRALDYFQQAVDASEDGKEYQILARTYAQMGTLYMYQKLYDEAMPMHKKAYHYYSLAKDSLLLSYALRDIGRAFTAQHNVDSTLYYYEAGYRAAKQMNDICRMGTIQGELSDLYLQLGRYKEAREALTQSSANLQGSDNIAPNNLIWGEYYEEVGQLDSAKLCYHKALEIGNVHVKTGAYLRLYQIERAEAQYEEALAYMDQYLIYQDSLQRITDTESVKKGEMLYNYRHVEKDNEQLAQTNAKKKTFIYQLVAGGLILLFAVMLFSYNAHRKKQQQLKQERRLRFFEEKTHKESLQQIESNNSQILLLKKQLIVAREQNNQAEEELLTIKSRLLEEKNHRIATLRAEQETLLDAFRHSAIYFTVIEKSKDPQARLTEEDWKKLQIELDLTFDNFTNRLYTLYPNFTEIELRVCYLLKISVALSDIAHLTVKARSSVSSIRERLYKKIHGVPGSSKDLDSFIVDF